MHTTVRVNVNQALMRLESQPLHESHESTYLHRLICLLCRLSAGDVLPWRPTTEQQRRLDLQCDLDAWHSTLPPSFAPDVRLPHVPPRRAAPMTTEHHHHSLSLSLFTEELWFASRTCALAMAYYHTAQILLAVPVQHRRREHARTIVAIGLGMQGDTALQTYLVQPLFVAGRLLSDADADADDRRRLLQMLRDMDTELGVCTAYRVEGLEEEWAWVGEGESEGEGEGKRSSTRGK